MHPDEPTPTPSSDLDAEPTVVTVSGSDATADRPVEMIEGVTGARMPTGDHPTSGAMPDQSSTNGAGGSAIGVAVIVLLLVVALFVIYRLVA